jgi:hypothetical protein
LPALVLGLIILMGVIAGAYAFLPASLANALATGAAEYLAGVVAGRRHARSRRLRRGRPGGVRGRRSPNSVPGATPPARSVDSGHCASSGGRRAGVDGAPQGGGDVGE